MLPLTDTGMRVKSSVKPMLYYSAKTALHKKLFLIQESEEMLNLSL